MSHSQPYARRKASGVDCIGEVPEHWEVVRVARLGTLRKASGGSKEDNVETGVPCVRYGDLYTTHDHWIRHTPTFIAEERASEYTPIRYGDVLFAASGETFEEIGKSAVNLLSEPACCGGDVILLRPSADADPLFLGYALDCSAAQVQKARMGKGFTVKHIYADELRSLIVALPPVAEQRVIAASLDREIARIDALIAKKIEFIDLLNTKRQALITQTVTKGLNPKAKMCDSGVEWIGDVPSHWRVCALGYVARTATGGTPDRNNESYWGGDIPWVKTGEINYSTIQSAEESVTVEGLRNSAAFVAPPGTILMAMYGQGVTRGRVAVLGIPAAFNQACAAIQCTSAAHNWYLYFSLQAAYRFIRDLGYETSQKNLSLEIISKLKVPIPPAEEQVAIHAHLLSVLERVDQLIERVDRSLALLHMRRSALITAAVTGQIDLRESA